jgi:uncharacterized protein (TIGR03083 family)
VGLSDAEWSGVTRCTEWRVLELAQHLISGSQFLGYTLHQSRKGEATRLLAGFDSQRTAAVTAAQFAGLPPGDLLERLDAVDAQVEHEIDSLVGDDWVSPAEAPPGQVPAYVAINHFLFDSWVHERDLMLPANQVPVTEPNEAAMVASYVIALTGVAGRAGESAPSQAPLRMRLSDVDRSIRVDVTDGRASVSFIEPEDHADFSARTADIVDFATGRNLEEALPMDQSVIGFLSRLAAVMA